MWSRFVVLGLCCLVAVSCREESDGRREAAEAVHGQNDGSHTSEAVGGNNGEPLTDRKQEAGTHQDRDRFVSGTPNAEGPSSGDERDRHPHDNEGAAPSGRPHEPSAGGASHSGDHDGQPSGLAHNEGGFSQSTEKPSEKGEKDRRPTETSDKGDSEKESEEKKKKDKEDEEDACFPGLGCFSLGKPWKSVLRPIAAPFAPEKINTTVFFYSRAHPDKQKNITLYPEVVMGDARFDPRKISVIIVHGFSSSGNASWLTDMKTVYLNKVDANVMIVDWGLGSQIFNYLQVAGNTRVVGKQLANFVNYLRERHGADPGKFHLIGHSLGAQICAYLAKNVPGIARLTALDPAQPGFEGFDKEVRLDKSDAEFVDVIHTDARPLFPTLGFGMITPHGHVDFYMNGGFDQPGCIPPAKKDLPAIKNILDFAKYPVEVIGKAVACPHGRSYEYLIEAFNETEKCIFWGHKADVKNVFKGVTNTVTQGLLKKFVALSTTCSKEDCIPLGFATKKSPLRGVFVVTTAARQPYCISEPGIPPETPPEERRRESFIQKIGKKALG